LKTIN